MSMKLFVSHPSSFRLEDLSSCSNLPNKEYAPSTLQRKRHEIKITAKLSNQFVKLASSSSSSSFYSNWPLWQRNTRIEVSANSAIFLGKKGREMDRLVMPDVKELKFVFKKGQKCSTSFRLSNLMHTMSVAVSLTTSNPSVYSFSQPFSVIPPLSSLSYSVFSQPVDQPPLTATPTIVTVRSSMVPIGKAGPVDHQSLFSKPGRHVFRDATILISFVGPQVVEFLISNYSCVPESSFLLPKAISECSESQLTELLKPAVLSGKANLVSALIDAGADVNVKESDGKSMISAAVAAGNIDIVKLLMSSNCRIDHSVDLILHRVSALNLVDLMEILYAHYRDVGANSIDSNGQTPIHIAATHGHVKAIQFCVSIGGNPDAVDSRKWTPLHCAAAEGHLKAVKFLLKCSNVKYALNKDGKTAYALAAEKGHDHLLDALHLGDELQQAAREGDVRRLKSCLAGGAKVNGRDQNGWTPLHRASFKGRIDCVKLLLEYGARVDAVDDEGLTPLHLALQAGHLQVVVLLFSCGAKGNDQCLKGLNFGHVNNHLPRFIRPIRHGKGRT